jgi:hypothetical protein
LTRDVLLAWVAIVVFHAGLWAPAVRASACDSMELWARAGDGNDTLFWIVRTDSMRGVYVYRRVEPQFMDSLAAAVDTTLPDSLLDYPSRLYKYGRIGPSDTVWVLVLAKMVPVAHTGAPTDTARTYTIVDFNVHSGVRYQYSIEGYMMDSTTCATGPVTTTPALQDSPSGWRRNTRQRRPAHRGKWEATQRGNWVHFTSQLKGWKVSMYNVKGRLVLSTSLAGAEFCIDVGRALRSTRVAILRAENADAGEALVLKLIGFCR